MRRGGNFDISSVCLRTKDSGKIFVFKICSILNKTKIWMIFVSWSITRGAYYTVNFVNNLQQFGNIFVCFFRKYSWEIGILGVVY